MLLSPSGPTSTSTNPRNLQPHVLIRGFHRSPRVRRLRRSDIRTSQSHLLPVKEERCGCDGGLRQAEVWKDGHGDIKSERMF